MFDGDLKLTESLAIYKHIVRKYGNKDFFGKTINEEALVDNLIFLYAEVDLLITYLFWDDQWKSKVDANKSKAKPKLVKINEFYG